MSIDWENLVEQAKGGDKDSLETIAEELQHRVYNLALRMLWNPSDAQDATQEIMIRVITHLGTFRGESKFLTWMYRVATNYLLKAKQSQRELLNVDAEKLGQLIEQGLEFGEQLMHQPEDIEQGILLEEVRIGCTLGMINFLDRKHRIVYLLGEVMKLNGQEGAAILELTPEAFRKRLSRARDIIRAFMKQRCGLVNQAAPCRCNRQLPFLKHVGQVNPQDLQFVGRSTIQRSNWTVLEQMDEVEELERAAHIYRSYPEYAAPEQFLDQMRSLLNSGKYKIFSEDAPSTLQ